MNASTAKLPPAALLAALGMSLRTIDVHDPVTEASHEARLRKIAGKLARRQGSWMCPVCKVVRISANAEMCLACYDGAAEVAAL